MSHRLFGILLIVFSLVLFYTAKGIFPTPALWSTQFDQEIVFSPTRVGDGAVIIGSQKRLALVGSAGEILARTELSQEAIFPPIDGSSTVVVVDNSGLKAYSADKLELRWKRSLDAPPRLSPISMANHRLLLATSVSTMAALDADTGNPIWEAHLEGELEKVIVGRTIICVFRVIQAEKRLWKMQAFDPDQGRPLWAFPGEVLNETPSLIDNLVVFENEKGVPFALDQITGYIRLKGQGEGFRILLAGEDSLILLAQGGTRLDCQSINRKSSWSSSLADQVIGAAAVKDRVLLADRQGIRCIEAGSGQLFWQNELGIVLQAFPHREGICVIFQQTSFDRQKLLAYFNAFSRKAEWICGSTSEFFPVIGFEDKDLVACRSGSLFGMSVPVLAASGSP